MKIRNNFVSNSSSSSFIIAGKNVLEILIRFIHDSNMVNYEPEWYDHESDFTYGEVIEEIVRQCKNSTNDMVKGVIGGLIYQSIDFYTTKCIYEIIPNQICACYMDDVSENKWYDKFIKGTEFDLPNEFKKKIENAIKIQYNKTNSENSWDYSFFKIEEYFPDYETLMNDFVNETYENYINKYGELYAVSFGDNHGKCSGRMGAFVEYDFLGSGSINDYLKTNFEIYRNNEH